MLKTEELMEFYGLHCIEDYKTSLSIIDILKDKIGEEKLHNTLITFDLFKTQIILPLSSFFTETDIFTKGSQKVRHRQVSIIFKELGICRSNFLTTI